MKKVFSILMSVAICVFSCTFLTGCVEKTYKLVGIANTESQLIEYYEDLSDDKKAILDSYKNFTIKLGFNNDITLKYATYDKPILTEYTITGDYKIENEKLIVSFTFENEIQNVEDNNYYYNNRILYYDASNDVYLVFE